MAVVESFIPVPTTPYKLDGVGVTTSEGLAVREMVTIGDPEVTAARACVTQEVHPDNYALCTTDVRLTFDAFNRLKTSQAKSTFAGFNEYKTNPFNYVTNAVGTGSATHSTTTKLVTLATGGTLANASAILQSRSYQRYTPGKSLNPTITFVMGAAPSTNVAKRAGYFDASNGVFFEYTSTGKRFVVRSNVSGSVVDTKIEQANWNGDKLDGTGESGLTLDLTKGQIFWMDLQFLGMGTVRFGFEIDGKQYLCHSQHHSNRTASQPYMATANLPIRFEITNTGAAGGSDTMLACCAKVDSDGGEDLNGIQFSASNGVTGKAVTTTLIPILSIRCAPTYGGITNRGWIIPQEAQIYTTGSNLDFYYQFIWNATLTGPSWTAVNTNSMAQYDVTASAVSLGSGVVIDEGYVGVGTSKIGSAFNEIFSDRPLVNSFDGLTPDTLTLAIRTVTGSGTAYGAINWHGHW